MDFATLCEVKQWLGHIEKICASLARRAGRLDNPVERIGCRLDLFTR